jgi:hypothetical protein
MKLVRIGETGKERPALLEDGRLRDGLAVHMLPKVYF